MTELVSIIPVETVPGEPTKTQGTRVVLADGTQLKGVTKIILTAETSDIWRAEIHCIVTAPKLENVEATIIKHVPPVDEQGIQDVTDLDSTSRVSFGSGVYPVDVKWPKP